MTDLAPDPIEGGGIAGFGARLRQREITVEQAVNAYLARIETLDPKLEAFEHVAGAQALMSARTIDEMMASGTDLGPLMGVCVVLKDLIAAEGMPTTAGSNVDVTHSIGTEGGFVQRLREAGCIILGKTKTVEFARGAAGINNIRGTPWNPWDASIHRIPGGSSSGSAVAIAAGMCGIAIGTDTGGSVRGPAAFCGAFGLKPTIGLWPLDGVFPNSPTFDTIGPMTRTAEDGAIVYSALSGETVPQLGSFKGLQIGKPTNHFFDDLDTDVGACVEAAFGIMADAGAEVVAVDVPEVAEREDILKAICAPECIAGIGLERFRVEKDEMDPITVARTAPGLDVSAVEYIEAVRRCRELAEIFAERFEGFDAWITPTTTMTAPSVAEVTDLTTGLQLEARLGLNTHPVSFFGLCSTTSPIQHLVGARLPIGLQIICAGGADAKAVSIARALEQRIGPPPSPNLSGLFG
ncbi:MAG: amidase [Rhodospirillales bacterium]|jgi:aspartyl-tRNA(Asn)/glutamyl-tRNA(Gln) amidotransferase subunit A|nr:amidase [Rhodospirillales bacterium]